MIKYWLLKEESKRLLLIKERTIYIGNHKSGNEIELHSDIGKGIIPENMFSIPYSYIRSVESQEGIDLIMIYYGRDSEEEIEIGNRIVKKEIFEFLRNELPKFEYIQKFPSIFKYTKPQIFAILITTVLFLWTFYLASEIEEGYEYEVIGGGNPGITGIVLGLAQFGTLKVILVYILAIAIAIYSFRRKIRNRSLTEYLLRIES